MTIIVRIAPSPSGRIQVGNLRQAFINWMFARKNNGKFMLRIDDTDKEKSKEEYVEGVIKDLQWLGLNWDVYARQSERLTRYTEVAELLKKAGRLYPCYETEEELGLKRKILLAQGKPPIYDRAALKLSKQEIMALETAGKKPHWRFKMNDAPIVWQDVVMGKTEFKGGDITDPVLIREDGTPLYMMPSVIDDADFGITHIIRGADHITNTAIQIQIFEAMGAKVPEFGHIPLLTDADGGKLSKRIGSLSVASFREAGVEPMALLSYVAKLGTSDAVEPRLNVKDLIDEFDFAKFSKSSAKFDDEDVYRLNTKLLHVMSYAEVKKDLPVSVDENLWFAIRSNLKTLKDVADWAVILSPEFKPLFANDGDQNFTMEIADYLPNELWDETTYDKWMAIVKEKTGRKGKDLFHPIRLALTGKSEGPELKKLLPILGRERVLKRLLAE